MSLNLTKLIDHECHVIFNSCNQMVVSFFDFRSLIDSFELMGYSQDSFKQKFSFEEVTEYFNEQNIKYDYIEILQYFEDK